MRNCRGHLLVDPELRRRAQVWGPGSSRRGGSHPDLVVLGEQIADGVVDEVDQPVGASGRDAGHVAHGHLEVVAVRLLAHPVNHVLRQLDAVHAHARLHERQGDTTGTHGELQRVSLTGELGEERDGLLLVASSVDGVVALRLVISEARPGVEALQVILLSDQACTGRVACRDRP
jgi:hypothetical protein